MAWLDSVLVKLPNPRNLLEVWTGSLLLKIAPWLLKSPNPRMRCKAVENLSDSTHPSDTELIFASLQDKEPQVRSAAVRALAKANKPGALKALIGALRDTSFQVREAAARGLARLGDVKSAGVLAQCLRDPDAAVRIAAASTLRTLGWKPTTREELAWFEIALGNTPTAEAADNGPAASFNIEPAQDTAFHRNLAAEALREKTDPIRISTLLAAVRGNDSLARISAVHDLGEINDPQIIQELLGLFRHPDAEMRLVAAQTLAARNDSSPAHFVGLLQDESHEVRLTAVEFLGRIRNQQIVDVLSPLLSDENGLVRQATARALGLSGQSSALDALLASLTDPDEHVRYAVEQALDQIDPDGGIRKSRTEQFWLKSAAHGDASN